ncbi:MAG: hypothetical protein AB7E30_10275 [Lawsonibacter sp.]
MEQTAVAAGTIAADPRTLAQTRISAQIGQSSPVQSWSASSAMKKTEKTIAKQNSRQMKTATPFVLLLFTMVFPLLFHAVFADDGQCTRLLVKLKSTVFQN